MYSGVLFTIPLFSFPCLEFPLFFPGTCKSQNFLMSDGGWRGGDRDKPKTHQKPIYEGDISFLSFTFVPWEGKVNSQWTSKLSESRIKKKISVGQISWSLETRRDMHVCAYTHRETHADTHTQINFLVPSFIINWSQQWTSQRLPGIKKHEELLCPPHLNY